MLEDGGVGTLKNIQKRSRPRKQHHKDKGHKKQQQRIELATDDVGNDHTFTYTWDTSYPEQMRRVDAIPGEGGREHRVDK